jgi:hypothetical protein
MGKKQRARTRADRARARSEKQETRQREDAQYPLLRGQDDTAMRAKLIEMSKGLRQKYGHTDPPA